MQRITGEELAKTVSIFVNDFSYDYKGFTSTIMGEHKTIQQSVIRLVMELIRGMSQQEYVDGRNELAVNLCKKITEQFGNEMRLPLI